MQCDICQQEFKNQHGVQSHKGVKHKIPGQHKDKNQRSEHRSRVSKLAKLDAEIPLWTNRDEFQQHLFYLKAECGLSGPQYEKIARTMKSAKLDESLDPSDIPISSKTILRAAARNKDSQPVFTETFSINTTAEGKQEAKEFKVEFHHFDGKQLIQSLLDDPDIDHQFTREANSEGIREITDGSWWKELLESPRFKDSEFTPLPIIGYTDSTSVGHFAVKSLKPIYLTVGSISTRERMEFKSKRVFGFMPKLEGNQAYLHTKPAVEARRMLVHEIWKRFMSSTGLDDPDTIFVSRDGLKLVPVFAFLELDHPEAQLTAGVKASCSTTWPCRFCMAHKCCLHVLRTDYQPMSRDVSFALLEKQSEISAHPEESPFNHECVQQHHENRGVGWLCPICSLHTFGQGLCKKLLYFVVQIIHHYGYPPKGETLLNQICDPCGVKWEPELPREDVVFNPTQCTSKRKRDQRDEDQSTDEDQSVDEDQSADEEQSTDEDQSEDERGAVINSLPLDSVRTGSSKLVSKERKTRNISSLKTAALRKTEFDRRFSELSPFSWDNKYSKRFAAGVSNLTFLTASENMSIVHQLPFIICDSGTLIPKEILPLVMRATIALLDIMLPVFDVQKIWTEDDLVLLEEHQLPALESSWSLCFRSLDKVKLNFLKFHEVKHLPALIRMYGSPMGFDTGSMENYHKLAVKAVYNQVRGSTAELPKKCLILSESLRIQKQRELRRNPKSEKNPDSNGIGEFESWMTMTQWSEKYGEEEGKYLDAMLTAQEVFIEGRDPNTLHFSNGFCPEKQIGWLRADPCYRKKARYDFVEVRNEVAEEMWVGRARAFCKDGAQYFAIIETFFEVNCADVSSVHEIMACRVFETVDAQIDIVPIEAISRRVALVPDFSSAMNNDLRIRNRFFVDRFDPLATKALLNEGNVDDISQADEADNVPYSDEDDFHQ